MDGGVIVDIQEYYAEFMQDIYARAGAQEDFYISVFTERMCDILVDQGITEDYRLIGYKKSTRGIRVDACDYNDDTEVLSLFVTDFRVDDNLVSLSQTDVTKNFNRAEKFFVESYIIEMVIKGKILITPQNNFLVVTSNEVYNDNWN